MLSPDTFKIGDWFTCFYNGKYRVCEIIDKPEGRDYMHVKTEDGFRNFKYSKIRSPWLKLNKTEV